MPPLTAEQLATLTHQHPELATLTAVLYIPHTRQLAACPNITAPLHACPNAFTLPQAAHLAHAFHHAGIQAHLLVYGIPWPVTTPPDAADNPPPTINPNP